MLKGKADNAASHAEPNSEKSYTQQAADALGSNSSNDQVSLAYIWLAPLSNLLLQRSLLDQAKDTLGLGHKSS